MIVSRVGNTSHKRHMGCDRIFVCFFIGRTTYHLKESNFISQPCAEYQERNETEGRFLYFKTKVDISEVNRFRKTISKRRRSGICGKRNRERKFFFLFFLRSQKDLEL